MKSEKVKSKIKVKSSGAIGFGNIGILLAIFIAVFVMGVQSVHADDCPDAYIQLISTDPIVGEPFSIKLVVTSGTPPQPWSSYQNATLTSSPSLTIIGQSPPVDTTNGFVNLSSWLNPFVWQLNATTSGNYNINVTLMNASTTCIENITVFVDSIYGTPHITLSMPDILNVTAKQTHPFNLILNNTGTGNAYNITGFWGSNDNVQPASFSINELFNSSSTTQSFNIQTSYCTLNKIITATVNYRDALNNPMTPVNVSDSFNVVGSDLMIESFTLDDYRVRVGDTVRFNIAVKNNDRNTSNATNVNVTIYRDSSVLATINLGNVSVGETKSGTATWRASNAGTNIALTAVVDSDQECNNWDNNIATQYITVISTITDEDGGAGGGVGEREVTPSQPSQPQPQPQPQPPQPQPQLQPATIISDDNLVIVKIDAGIKIYVNGNQIGNQIDASDVKIEKIEKDDVILLPSLPQDLYLIRAYSFKPSIIFSDHVDLIVKYREDLLPDAQLYIYSYENGWKKLETVWDRENKQLISSIKSASIIGLFVDKIEYKKSWTSAVIGWIKVNWYVPAIGILAIIAAITVALAITKRKR